MKRSQCLALWLVVAAGVAGGVALYLADRGHSDEVTAAKARQRAAYLASVPAPPADPPPGASTEVRRKPVPRTRPATLPTLEAFRYDPALTVEENLVRYRAYCAADTNSTSMVTRSAGFEAELLKRIGSRWDILQAGLDDPSAPAFYRMIMLRCLVKTGCPNRDDIVWRYALDVGQGDLSTVAAEALRDLDPADRRPAEYLRLLESASGDRAVFALQAARFHMDDQVLAAVERIVATRDDMNVRVAAVHAVGDAKMPEAHRFLMAMADVPTPTNAQPLSETSVLKRTAIWRLDTAQPGVTELVRRLALDPAEDPGVRRKAMLKIAESGGADAEAVLTRLVAEFPENEMVLLKGGGEALMCLGTPGARAALDRRIATLKSSEARRVMNRVVNGDGRDGGGTGT